MGGSVGGSVGGLVGGGISEIAAVLSFAQKVLNCWTTENLLVCVCVCVGGGGGKLSGG